MARDAKGPVDPGARGVAIGAVQNSEEEKTSAAGGERRASEKAGQQLGPLTKRAGASARRLTPAPPEHTLDHACQKDRIIVLTRDSYWIHAYWELSRTTLSRARAALGQDWHEARPILRVMDVSSEDTTSSAERHVRDIPIHGGVNNWYIDVLEPPRSYRVDVGYVSRRGKFYVLARSNVVTTPPPASPTRSTKTGSASRNSSSGSITRLPTATVPINRSRQSTCAIYSKSGSAGR